MCVSGIAMHPSCVRVVSVLALMLNVVGWNLEAHQCEREHEHPRERRYLLLGISRIAIFNLEQEKNFVQQPSTNSTSCV